MVHLMLMYGTVLYGIVLYSSKHTYKIQIITTYHKLEM